MSVSAIGTPSAAGDARRGEEAAWNWLQAQLAGRPLPPVLAIIGLGDLSILAALDARAPRTKVLALEPDAARATAALTSGGLDDWRRSGRLLYLTGPDFAGADQAWRFFPAGVEQPPLIVEPGSAGAAGARKAVAVLGKIVFGARANAEARRKFAPRYLLNVLRNLPAIAAGGDVRILDGWAAGKPAVVVGAGPSLDASLDELKRLQGGAIVIATDTSLRPLLAHGITPQFVVALDPSALNGRHLADLPAHPDTWLVAESALDPRATAEFEGRTLWFRVAPHEPWPWLTTLGIDVGRLEVWGSVLTAAYQVAVLAGCAPIVMVGADLSFPDGRPYARGTTYEFDWAWAAAFGTPVEETWRAQLTARKDLRVERDVTGVDTATSAIMLEFRDWLVGQARKGAGLVNGSGRGLLLGEGIAQACLSDVIPSGQVAPPPRFDLRVRPFASLTTELAHAVDDMRRASGAHGVERAPLPRWREFSGEGFDGDALCSALESAANALMASGKAAPAPPVDRGLDHGLERLPETITRLRSALRGETSVAAASVSMPGARDEALARAFGLLRHIVEAMKQHDDLPGYPDPDRVHDTPAGASAMWRDDVRRDVLRFEGILGGVWGRPVSLRASDFVQREIVSTETGSVVVQGERPYATHACVLLLIEWLACVVSTSESAAASIGHAVERLRTLEGILRTPEEWARPKTATELVVDLKCDGTFRTVSLPLALSAQALWTLRTGLVYATEGAGPTATCLLGAADGGMAIRVAVGRETGAAQASVAALAGTMIARRLGTIEGHVVKIAGQVGGSALCVVPGARATWLVDAAGRFSRYQEWPYPVTGALSLGSRGEVAWSGASSTSPDGPKPYVMYRPSLEADVTTIPLPFRPSQGVWYRGHVFWNCLPNGSEAGGAGSWAPGEAPVARWPQLALQGLIVCGDELCLEPYFADASGGLGRTRAAGFGAWAWKPGAPSRRRTLGPLGAASSAASNGRWTAVAYPQADLITLRSATGRAHYTLQCYFPMRLAWAGASLLVFAADRDLLLFEGSGALGEGER